MKRSMSKYIRVTVSISLILILLYVMRDKYPQILAVLKATSVPLFSLVILA